MNAFTCSLFVFWLGVEQPQDAPVSVADGAWRVVSAEIAGPAARTTGSAGLGGVAPGTSVTIRRGVLSFARTQPAQPAPESSAGVTPEKAAGATPRAKVRGEAPSSAVPPPARTQSWRLAFGPNNRLVAMRVTESARSTMDTAPARSTRRAGYEGMPTAGQSGVYVLTRDYLCLSFGTGTAWPEAAPAEQKGAGTAANPRTTAGASAAGGAAPSRNTADNPSTGAVPGAAEGMQTAASPRAAEAPDSAASQPATLFVLILRRDSGTSPGERVLRER